MVEYIPPEMAKRLSYDVYLAEAMKRARFSKCLTRRVGAVVTNSIGRIVGRGTNMPPNGVAPVACNKMFIPKVGGPNDRHCCLHAEEIALYEAIRTSVPHTLLFADIDKDGKLIPCASKPYCTQCSKKAYFLGVSYWVCYHAKGVWPEGEGFYRYSAKEYNDLSFAFRDPDEEDRVKDITRFMDRLKQKVEESRGQLK